MESAKSSSTPLDVEFDAAAEAARGLSLNNGQKLQLYGLYKQATAGNVATKRPGFFDMVGCAKWDAWKEKEGLGQEEAKTEYVKIVAKFGGKSYAEFYPTASHPSSLDVAEVHQEEEEEEGKGHNLLNGNSVRESNLALPSPSQLDVRPLSNANVATHQISLDVAKERQEAEDGKGQNLLNGNSIPPAPSRLDVIPPSNDDAATYQVSFEVAEARQEAEDKGNQISNGNSIPSLRIPSAPPSPSRLDVMLPSDDDDVESNNRRRHSSVTTRTLMLRREGSLRAYTKHSEIEQGLRPPIPPLPQSIYFGGSAFAAAFYTGVCRAMTDMWGHDFQDHTFLSGDSVGAIVAVGMALRYPAEELYGMYMRISMATIESGHYFYNPCLNKGASICMEREIQWLLSNPDAYALLNGRCWIGVTHFPDKHFWVKQFKSNQDVFNALVGSCHIPVYCHPNPRIDGKHVVDGAFSVCGGDLPHQDQTLFVGVGRLKMTDVTRVVTKKQLLHPPDDKAFAEMENTGYEAMWNWDGTFKKKVGVLRVDKRTKLLWAAKCVELSWVGMLVLVPLLVVFVVLMCLHFVDGTI